MKAKKMRMKSFKVQITTFPWQWSESFKPTLWPPERAVQSCRTSPGTQRQGASSTELTCCPCGQHVSHVLVFLQKNAGEFPISQTCFGISCRELSKSMPSATFFIKGNTERTDGNTSSPLTSPLPSLQDSWNTDFSSYTTSQCCQRRDETIPRRTIHASQPPDWRGHPGALMGFWFWAIPSNSIWKCMGSLA